MRLLPIVAVAAALAAAGTARGAADGAYYISDGRPASDVVFEAGWAIPYGDLADDFRDTPRGFGGEDGLEVGFRWRLYVSDAFSLAPAFHFTDYGGFSGSSEELGDHRLDCSSYRLTVEAMIRMAEPGAAVRPFLAVSGGLHRNRVVGITKTFVTSFDESVNTLGAAARVGIAIGDLELSAVYAVDRFSTPRYFGAPESQDYRWDTLVVRGGWVVPFGGVPREDLNRRRSAGRVPAARRRPGRCDRAGGVLRTVRTG